MKEGDIMATIIREYKPDDREYKALEKASAILTAVSAKGITYKVENTYFDYGQNWRWTTIIAYDPNAWCKTYQALCPRDYEKILYSTDMLKTIQEIREDEYFTDK